MTLLILCTAYYLYFLAELASELTEENDGDQRQRFRKTCRWIVIISIFFIASAHAAEIFHERDHAENKAESTEQDH